MSRAGIPNRVIGYSAIQNSLRPHLAVKRSHPRSTFLAHVCFLFFLNIFASASHEPPQRCCRTTTAAAAGAPPPSLPPYHQGCRPPPRPRPLQPYHHGCRPLPRPPPLPPYRHGRLHCRCAAGRRSKSILKPRVQRPQVLVHGDLSVEQENHAGATLIAVFFSRLFVTVT